MPLNKETNQTWFDWFGLMAYQLFLGYLMPLKPFSKKNSSGAI